VLNPGLLDYVEEMSNEIDYVLLMSVNRASAGKSSFRHRSTSFAACVD
jgi:pentose-5-phosphate-3-epimerase